MTIREVSNSMVHSDSVGIEAGSDAINVNNVLAALLPAAVVTTTLAGPAVPGGVKHVADVEDNTVTFVQGIPPIVIPVMPVKSVPVMVMVVPPVSKPVLGDTDVTVGGRVW